MKSEKTVKLVKKTVRKVVTEEVVTQVFIFDRAEAMFIRDLLCGMFSHQLVSAFHHSINYSNLTSEAEIVAIRDKLSEELNTSLNLL